jgi:hypothetical protein
MSDPRINGYQLSRKPLIPRMRSRMNCDRVWNWSASTSVQTLPAVRPNLTVGKGAEPLGNAVLEPLNEKHSCRR